MADVKIQIEPVTAASGGRSARRLLVRGQQRTIVKRLQKALQNAVRADEREERRAEAKGYGPFLVKESANSGYAKAMAALITRTTQMLKARA